MQDLTFTKYDVLEDIKDIHSKYDSIIKFKRSLEKIQMLIELSQTQQEKTQLQQMKNNIIQALTQQITQLKEQEKKKKLFSLSIETLKQSDIGKLSKCYIEQQRKWKNSQILQVDEQEQTALIFQYGKNQKLTLPAYKLKVLKTPDPQVFKESTFCKCIYSGDGQFYPCVIEKVQDDNYHVKYKKYGSKQVVKLHRLREFKTMDDNNDKQYKFQDLNQLKIPEQLKIKPNDPQNVKKSKKTKVKAMKFAFKNAQIQEVNKQKQSNWKSFNSGLNYGHTQSRMQKDLNSVKEQRNESQKSFPKPFPKIP